MHPKMDKEEVSPRKQEAGGRKGPSEAQKLVNMLPISKRLCQSCGRLYANDARLESYQVQEDLQHQSC